MIITRPMLAFSPDQGGGGGGTRTDGQDGGGKTTPDGQDGSAGKAQQDKAGSASKTTDVDLPSDPAQLRALLAQERADKAHLLSVHSEMKTKAEQREQAEAKAREENLKKQGEFQKLLEEQSPQFEAAKQAVKRYEEVLNRYLETELKAIPENLKALMPEGDPASKLDWIAKAKESGAVKAGQVVPKKPGDGSPPPGGSSAGTMTRSAFDLLSPDEKSSFLKSKGKVVD